VTVQIPNIGPAREVALFRDYLDKHPYGSECDSFSRAHDEQYFRLSQLGDWLSTEVRIVAGGTDGTPKQRLERLLAAQAEYEAAHAEIAGMFGKWIPAAEAVSVTG
jgi:hypothetical protein